MHVFQPGGSSTPVPQVTADERGEQILAVFDIRVRDHRYRREVP
ncbi:hypothetical protein RGF97_25695 [Streptomyces roseicoloratus]|uniref:Uncharacterized protein n=1 Tax=Streptomyces roseicoloratus TaxID=2508722 RepID=A0ABY9RZD4_9ACTN|nr:hypothetical protein [Streptomyces roseicoloratus]WMX47531.1 hypothetical protein RGF97_25695 [Streptomyces roseicoloratus]